MLHDYVTVRNVNVDLVNAQNADYGILNKYFTRTMQVLSSVLGNDVFIDFSRSLTISL